MKIRHLILIIILLSGFISCKRILSFFNGSELVASQGKHKLYKNELKPYIPDDISPEDSLLLVQKYIKSWRLNYALLDLAQAELSDKEKDVHKELEDYKISLLKYRYEQAYINQRLDTTVSEQEIDDYYNKHKELFILDNSVIKLRFLRIAKDSPNLKDILENITSDNEDDLNLVDSLAYHSALRYNSFDNNWVDISILSKEFSMDDKDVLAHRKNNFIKIDDSKGNWNIAYIPEIVEKGKLGPKDYFKQKIKDIILSTRKQKLIDNLEQEILNKDSN